MVLIRKSVEEDLKRILHIWNKNTKTMYRPFVVEVEQKVKDGEFLVAIDMYGSVIGFVTYSNKNRLKEFRLEHLCVDLPHRGDGIGTELLREAVKYNTKNYKVTGTYIEGASNNIFYDSLYKKDIISKIEERLLPSGITLIKIEFHFKGE